ncbi:MAG: MFS transporter [Deltaproteobacteria bacterium]|nr:MFS transporter [Deltaproteobacteria bacterium]
MSVAVATAALPGARLGERGRALVVLLSLPLFYACFGLTWMGFVPVMPEITGAFGVERASGALLITVISMAKSVVPILAGVVAARLGLRRTLLLAGALVVVAGAAPFLPTWGALVAARFVLGVGGAVWVTLLGPAGLAVLPSSWRPVANAANGIAVNLGVVVALAVTLPLASMIGWQWAVSVGTLGAALCLLLTASVGPFGAPPAPAPIGDTLAAYARTLKLRETWILALAFSGPLALYLVLNTFLGQHLEAAFALPRATAMRWLVWLNLWGMPASLGAGFLLARVWRSPKPYLVVASLLLPLAVAGGVLAPTDGLRALAFALAGLGMFLPVSPLITTVQQLPGQTPGALGMILGTMFAVTYVVSSAVPSAIGPLLAQGMSLSTLLIAAGVLGATPIAGLLLRSRSA